jgi:hypothetical protein
MNGFTVEAQRSEAIEAVMRWVFLWIERGGRS